MGLPVVLLTTTPEEGIPPLQRYFEMSPEFQFHRVTLGEEEEALNIKCPNLDLKLEHQHEITGFLRALAYGDLQEGLLVVRESAQTLLPTATLAEFLTTLRTNYSFDLAYLGRYLDRCDLYTEVGAWNQLRIMKTTNSNGSFALYFTPQGLRRLRSPGHFEPYQTSLGRNLSGQVFTGRLTALTTEPPIFTHQVVSERDWVKTHACKVPTELNEPQLREAVQPLSFWWFLLIVLGIIALALWLWPRT